MPQKGGFLIRYSVMVANSQQVAVEVRERFR